MDVFMAVENVVRCAEITSGSAYKTLDIAVNFPILSLELNASGTLLAVVGECAVVVTSLPSPGFMQRGAQTITVKNYSVGVRDCAILKVLWNGAARHDSTLLTLSADNVIRLYDLALSHHYPHSEYNVKPQRQSGFFSAEAMEGEPVSISFGAASNPQGSLTLYVLTSVGEVFAIFPFSPAVLAVSHAFVEVLFHEAALKVKESSQEDSESEYPNKQQSVLQLHWAAHLWKQVDSSTTEVRVDNSNGVSDMLYLLSPEKLGTPKLQGPLGMSPFPQKLYDSLATDITSVACGETTVLAVAFTDGVLICVQNDELSMAWTAKEDNESDDESNISVGYVSLEDTPCLSVAEYIEFPLCELLSIAKSSTPYVFYVITDTFLQVNFSKWGKVLNNAIVESKPGLFIALLSAPLETELLVVREARDGETAAQAMLLGICELGEVPVVVTVGGKSVEIVEAYPKPPVDGSKARAPILAKSDVKVYETLLSGPLSEITQLLEQVHISNIKAVPLTTDKTQAISGTPHEDVVSDFNAVSQATIQQVINLHKVGLALYHRLIDQQRELRRQVETVADLSVRDKVLEKVASKTDKQAAVTRIDTAVKRQAELVERLAGLEQKVQGYVAKQRAEMPISSSEVAWFKEINDVNAVSGVAGFKTRLSGLEQQFENIKQHVARPAVAPPVEDVHRFNSLKMYLDEEQALMLYMEVILKQGLETLGLLGL
ncbi:hypothetical protein BABINDRAFT_160455 [Babjeviella inositovora NRRL Y-12698]|uniref:Uncharacterized protein n=1 Tax=Babjeviella inositovora NRRL Y-12698 TaxID=984486 RepID=A0A1E3QTM8_9ASCO|nr:uncharacterized protein BABINDRAFT_160455 [Babjeviella inositovora NRRL Y-12698]ODQ81038.1 hypothetical protein BABINDRAFT_160455 [Babjeviella inositovora NRRL Y-12698]